MSFSLCTVTSGSERPTNSSLVPLAFPGRHVGRRVADSHCNCAHLCLFSLSCKHIHILWWCAVGQVGNFGHLSPAAGHALSAAQRSRQRQGTGTSGHCKPCAVTSEPQASLQLPVCPAWSPETARLQPARVQVSTWPRCPRALSSRTTWLPLSTFFHVLTATSLREPRAATPRGPAITWCSHIPYVYPTNHET
jgi:hypothetical protein